MAVIRANSRDVDMLARLMRAEAEGEGVLGMLMVGNVGVNRILANCLDFRGIRTMSQMVFQSPGGFEGCKSRTFTSAPGTRKGDWPDATSTANGSTLPQTRCGSSGRPETVRPSGIINEMQDASKRTASLYLPRKIVHEFTKGERSS